MNEVKDEALIALLEIEDLNNSFRAMYPSLCTSCDEEGFAARQQRKKKKKVRKRTRKRQGLMVGAMYEVSNPSTPQIPVLTCERMPDVNPTETEGRKIKRDVILHVAQNGPSRG